MRVPPINCLSFFMRCPSRDERKKSVAEKIFCVSSRFLNGPSFFFHREMKGFSLGGSVDKSDQGAQMPLFLNERRETILLSSWQFFNFNFSSSRPYMKWTSNEPEGMIEWMKGIAIACCGLPECGDLYNWRRSGGRGVLVFILHLKNFYLKNFYDEATFFKSLLD